MTHYYDQHLHTHHSFDSTESFENYLEKTNKTLVTTEHLDFYNPADGFKDSLPNFKLYNEEIKQLEQRYERSILRGIEVGYVPSQHELITDFVGSNPYDLILLSTHQNGDIDFMDPIVREWEKKKLVTEYYEQMILSVEEMTQLNILTHFDYGMRQLSIDVSEYQKLAESLLIDLFKKVIDKKIAVELNAKSFVKYNNRHLYEYAIPLYISLGGKLFTLGSDAHVASDYELGFLEMGQLLKDNNIHELAIFKQQKMTMVPF
ncbi:MULTISPECIES: PHP domain-containing protein [Vagococcus]|uniref:Histidinol-phosphatase n=1 Tax=Vagococcus fluvialis bH819 TaxID=1255619 RepID=A0A1X6WQW0_9ENTE|nr:MULTISPECIES: PHP domain-containing protein [Vagococcus]SLM86649.1 Histidinol-phosphatase [Vagococcus fluvialis bH819]HCM90857.1 histidinol phosphate phosphatase [Vagococcus sp.]